MEIKKVIGGTLMIVAIVIFVGSFMGFFGSIVQTKCDPYNSLMTNQCCTSTSPSNWNGCKASDGSNRDCEGGFIWTYSKTCDNYGWAQCLHAKTDVRCGCPSGICRDTFGNGETCANCPADCKGGDSTCAIGYCGDRTCNNGESCSACPGDCGNCQYCGDGTCNSGETKEGCCGDCGCNKGYCSITSGRHSCLIDTKKYCGDGTCNNGENCSTCPGDCGNCQYCGDGTCNYGENCSTCGDCGNCQYCGDGTCNSGETKEGCCGDCGCNKGYCSITSGRHSCLIDTKKYCGDGTCNNGENCSTCPGDCNTCQGGIICGNEKCEAGENYLNCVTDCEKPKDTCGNKICDVGEGTTTCPNDCKKGEIDLQRLGICAIIFIIGLLFFFVKVNKKQ